MAIIEKSRKLRPEHGDEIVVLVDDFGVEHHVYIQVTGEKCAHCHRPFEAGAKGAVDVEAEIERAKKTLQQREERLKEHAARRGYSIAAAISAKDGDCKECG